MLTTQQIQNAYLDSGLDSYPDSHWVRLNEQERWKQIEELIKSLLMRSEFPNLVLPSDLQMLYRVWKQQSEAFKKLCRTLNINPIVKKAKREIQQIFYSREEKNKAYARQAADILASYIRNFGDFEPSRLHYWPEADFIMDRYYYDVNEFSEWLQWYCRLPKSKKRFTQEAASIEAPKMALMA